MAKAQDEYVIKFGIEGETALAKLRVELAQTNKKLKEHTKLTEKQNGASGSAIQQNKRLTSVQNKQKASIKAQTAALKGNVAQTKRASKGLGMMALKATAVIAGVRQLSRFLLSSVKDFAAFEKGIKNVTTLMSGDDAAIFKGELYAGALDISKKYGFALKDITKAMFDSVSAGVKAGDTLEFLNEASRLAMAGVTTLKSATTGLTTVLNAYGMSADKAREVSEILFTTQKFGVTTVEELSKSLGVVVPFAAASGISIEELGAAIATTTRSGLDAAKSVTALRAAISQMQKPAAASRDLFIKFGIPIGSAQLKAVGFTETMRRLNTVYKESPEVIEKMFGNVRGLTAIFSLAGDNAEQYQEILAKVSDETERSANLNQGNLELLDSMDTRINTLNASYKEFKISMGDSEFFKELVRELSMSLDILGSKYLSFWDKLNPFLTQDTTHAMHKLRESAAMTEKAMDGMFDVIASGEDVNILGMLSTPEGIPAESLDRVKDVMEMAKTAQAVADKSKASPLGIDLGFDYTKLLAEYEGYLAGIRAFDDAAVGDKKTADDAKAARAIAAQKFEYNQRVKLKNDIERINEEALKDNTYKGVTEEAILRNKLANFTAIENFYLKNKGASEEEMLRVSNQRAKLAIELKKKELQNREKNTKGYNDKQDELAKIHYSDSITAAQKQAETKQLTNKEFRIKTIQDEIAFYNALINLNGASTEEQEKNIKKLNGLNIQLAKLENTEDNNNKEKKVALAKEAISIIGDAKKKALEVELENELKALDKKGARIDQEAADGLINQREQAQQKESIEKDAFELRKQNELKMAKISLMIELANIAVNAAANPTNAITFGGAGISQYALLAGLAIGRYALTSSTIRAQEFARGGMVHGNSHAQGGEKFAVGGRVVELEGGEAVINKKSSAMFSGALSAMNVAGGGTSFGSPNRGASGLIDYEALGNVIGRNTNVVLPIESLNKTQNRVKMLERSAKF